MLFIFSIYDSAAKFYMPPFMVPNKGVALREFADACNHKDSFLAKHPADFRMFRLGDFDDNSGVLSPLAQPEFLCNAVEFLNKDNVV